MMINNEQPSLTEAGGGVIIRYVWEIEGPCRKHDSYILAGDTEEQHQKAKDFAMEWLEDIWDYAEVGDPAQAVSIRLRKANSDDREILAEDAGQDDSQSASLRLGNRWEANDG